MASSIMAVELQTAAAHPQFVELLSMELSGKLGTDMHKVYAAMATAMAATVSSLNAAETFSEDRPDASPAA